MKLKINNLLLFTLSAATILSCNYSEDPGPLQEIEKQFSIVDFDRLEMGDAFNITIEQGNFFEVSARGDRRNIEDLSVTKEGSTLMIRYKQNGNRRHETYLTIKMPELLAANFSGASDSRVSGFNDLKTLDLYLSGASTCQLDVSALHLNAILSSASFLNLRGGSDDLKSELSGASVLKAFNFPVVQADINASGASHGNVTVSNKLKATANGASVIIYRGNPVLTTDVSGASTVRQD